MINSIKDKEVILNILKECSELIFDNDGYQYLSKDIKDKYKDEIDIIETILKKYIERFSRFDNFKPRQDGSIVIRCQYGWSESFTGVGYFDINTIFNIENH